MDGLTQLGARLVSVAGKGNVAKTTPKVGVAGSADYCTDDMSRSRASITLILNHELLIKQQ